MDVHCRFPEGVEREQKNVFRIYLIDNAVYRIGLLTIENVPHNLWFKQVQSTGSSLTFSKKAWLRGIQ